jgi:hypothetical protein
MSKLVRVRSARGLRFQVLAHALIFVAQNAGSFAERALRAPDTSATAALGLCGVAFCPLSAFTTNLVTVCQVVVGRRTGEGDERRGEQTSPRSNP